MKRILLALAIISHAAFAQQEIALYKGIVPNAIRPTVTIDTSVTRNVGDNKIDILHGVITPTLTLYLPDPAKATGTAVIICPGGGYSILAISHEGHDMAKKFNEAGIAAFVLKYRLPRKELMPDKRIGPLQDAQRAIQLVRENARQWNIHPNKIGILGSSAGGHLASTAGTHFEKAYIDNLNSINLRPDFMILNYPVISFSDSLTHQGSRMNLIGNPDVAVKGSKKFQELGMTKEDVILFSNELQVTPKTPPTFITAPLTDNVVPAGNTFAFIAAMQQNKVPVETFIYEKGPHGFGMHNATAREQWFDACLRWIKKNFEPNMDWANLKRFENDNKKVLQPAASENRIVFMGNSITEGWSKLHPDFWKDKPYINRGISGQTTPQMLLRFKQDVIDLKPKVVVILAGTNDIAGNTGSMTLEQSRDNIIAMAQLAKANGIKVVLSSVIPAYDFPWRPGLEPAGKIVALNQMIKRYCDANKIVYLDYHAAMKDERNGLKNELGYDGVHPNEAGYKVMGPLAEKAIAEALKRK
ncbi:MAG: alpha/beta hydrolase fold domain-containing protein [Cyclobacteriaceae bacterium]|nr:alpha/beta hydrolase fold domain-containing protein [Cyclobacteriaceae bacterium]